MNHWTRYSLQVSSFILTGVSIIFTVLLWSQLPSQSWMKLFTGAAGFALELCKFALLPFSFLLLRNRETTAGLILLLIGCALFTVSIAASVTFLETGEQARQRASDAWQQKQESLNQLDEQIRLGQLAASEDINNGYRQRGLETLKTVQKWQAERETLANIPINQNGNLSALKKEERFYAWLLLALLIDGCSVAGWTILASQEQQKVKLKTVSEAIPETIPKTVSETRTEIVTTEMTGDYSEANPVPVSVNDEVYNRITSGTYGEKITVRGFMSRERIGYQKAKKILDGLEAEGILMNGQRGYELINKTRKE